VAVDEPRQERGRTQVDHDGTLSRVRRERGRGTALGDRLAFDAQRHALDVAAGLAVDETRRLHDRLPRRCLAGRRRR
jgi:hypothetical protein